MTEKTELKSRKIRIHQALARKIGTHIITGHYQPGLQFVGEIENAEKMGVSRTAYREAIRILIAKGLLESRPKAGTKVTQRSSWNILDPEILEWMFDEKPDNSFVQDLFELRSIVEPEAASLAAQRRTADHIQQMDQALIEMEKHGLGCEAGRAGDREFHATIFQAANNQALSTLTGSIEAAVTWTTRFKQLHNPAPRDPLPDHIDVRDAIANEQPEQAKQAMRKLLMLAKEEMPLN